MESKISISSFFVPLLTLMSLGLHATEKTDRSWDSLLSSKKFTPTEQSYCYSDERGRLQGKNIDMPVRLASVSKLFVSLWAIDKWGPDYRFKTRLYIKGTNVHMAGSMDPFMGNQKMFYLLSELNRLGYKKFERITFDKVIQINPNAEGYAEQYPLITRESNARNLKMYFNTAQWAPSLKDAYKSYVLHSRPGTFQKEVNFEIADAVFSETNPFQNDPEVKVLTLSSPPLYRYLKEMNIQSNNYVAQTLFLKLGGESAFKVYMEKKFNAKPEELHFWSGSGLPTMINGVRNDNFGTCAIVTSVISALKEALEDKEQDLEDVVAVPGSDGGTFSNRIFPAEYTNAFVAKTGTLMHTSALAGAMNTQKGYSFYGIFNQSTDIVNAKIIQNEMIINLMTEMGGPRVFNYTVVPFDPYGPDTLKDLREFPRIETDFLAFDEGLK